MSRFGSEVTDKASFTTALECLLGLADDLSDGQQGSVANDDQVNVTLRGVCLLCEPVPDLRFQPYAASLALP